MADARLSPVLPAWLLLGFACQPAEPAVAPAARPVAQPHAPERAVPQPELPRQAWSAVSSSRQSIELMVPERDSWFVDDQTTHWFVLRHAATRSELVVRSWRAARLVRREECEKQARLWRPSIPETAEESVMEKRQLEAPVGFSTELTVGVLPVPRGGEIQGFALAFGTATARCIALVYTTSASGVGADAAVGRRLAIVADEIVPRLRFRGIDERVR